MPEAATTVPDFFLKLDGIDGESTDSKHPGELGLLDFSMGASNRAKWGDYGGGSKAVIPDVRFFMYVDISYPKLKLACATGASISKAVLTCRKAGKGQQEYLRVTFSDLLITSCEITAGHPKWDEAPVVEFALSFVQQQMEYREQRDNGTLGGSMMAKIDLTGQKAS
jgi:type VI secretion system secreted protein Hcp